MPLQPAEVTRFRTALLRLQAELRAQEEASRDDTRPVVLDRSPQVAQGLLGNAALLPRKVTRRGVIVSCGVRVGLACAH